MSSNLNNYLNNRKHLLALKREVEHLKTLVRPHDTGYIKTTISTLQDRIKQIEQDIDTNQQIAAQHI